MPLSVERLALAFSAQVRISRFVSLSPELGSVLTAQSPLGILSVSLSVSLCLCVSLSLSLSLSLPLCPSPALSQK